MEHKFYQLATYTEQQWDEIHEELSGHGSISLHVPSRCVECFDNQLHSPTRGTYILTDEEAKTLKNDPRIKFINIDYKSYPKEFKPPPEELQSVRPELIERYSSGIRNYREWSVSGTLAGNAGDANRTGYQLYRCQQKLDPWVDNGLADNFVVTANISQYGTGKHVDVIVADDGTWFGHPEFQRLAVLTSSPSTEIENPNGYTGGNLLPGNGYCDLLDLVLDSPYYIDPEWFDADPANRLTTRWDGTTVPVESIARTWWSNSTQRSSKFANIGTVTVTSGYTRSNCNGSNIAQSAVGNHGTACSALAYGRTQGWAYNSNKWAFNLYNTYGTDIEQGFDIVKIFHQHKPVNPLYGTKDPTVMSNSWGYRANKDPSVTGNGTQYYTHRTTNNVSYTTETGINWLSHMGSQGDGGRWKSEMKPNSYTEALDELISSGVIFVAAAGNSNQKCVSSDHPDFNNYITATNGGTLLDSNFTEFGLNVYGTTNRRGFPQQGGKYIDDTGNVIYPVINIGALDDDYKTSKETKVGYSDRGNEIDVYAPADGTLAANRGYGGGQNRVDTYSQYRIGTGSATDTGFSGIFGPTTRLVNGNIFPQAGNSFRISTVPGVATVTPISQNISNITSNPVLSFTGSDDDGYLEIPLPWMFIYNGSAFGEVFIGTNSYLTLGAGSTVYSGINEQNPPVNKICVSAADNSVQVIYSETQGVAPNRTFIIRVQGTASTSGILGSPNMEWEWHFFENNTTTVELHISLNARITTVGVTAPVNTTDTAFSGTSAACPVAAGFISTVLEHNRDWTWRDVRSWLQSLDIQDSSDFYYGTESTTPTTSNWTDYQSLEGGDARVIYQDKIEARFRSGTRPVLRGIGQSISNFRYRK